MTLASSRTLAAIALAAAMPVAAQDAALKDVVGGKDHPVVSRYAGSALVGYGDLGFDAAVFPLTNEIDGAKFVKPQVVEGRVQLLAYLAPAGRSVLEVQRNYEDALVKAGFVRKFACARDDCRKSARIQTPYLELHWKMKEVQSYGGYSLMAAMVLNTDLDPYYTWGTLKVGGRDVSIGVFSSRVQASDTSPLNNRTGTFIQIVEPKAMETGQVAVDANAMQKGLSAEGRIALYGVYFDSGKADVKPESKAQLEQMAKLLDADRSLKVFVVGHTDNVGAVDGNLALSQRRAEAIVASLAKDYRVDPKRLVARGVANFAPIASNDGDDGRARNRRVELVKQ